MTTIALPFHLDQPIEGFQAPIEVDRLLVPEPRGETAWDRMVSIYRQVAAAVADAPSPVVMSGDCTTSLATVAGLQRGSQSPAIVWLDAHGDFNTEETTESGYLGGMPLAKICGLGDLDVIGDLGLATVAPDPDELPGLLFPVPGGAAKASLEAAIGTVVASGRLAAIGLGLTWDPASSDPGRETFVRDVLRPLSHR
jgi:arginase